MSTIDIGDSLRVKGEWVDGCKSHDFPVVRVKVFGIDQEIPWPLSDVEATSSVEASR